MKIKWLGHSCFLLTSKEGTRILMDPFTPGQFQNYPEFREAADIVTVSHGHADHNNVAAATGNPVVVKESKGQKIKDISIRGVDVWHDEKQGKERGADIIFCLEIDGIRFCHTGDLGHILDAGQLKELGDVDVLCLPIDGVFNIDAGKAQKVCNDIKPRVAIPMHYKTDRCDWPQWSARDFVRDAGNVRNLDSNETEITADKLPAATEYLIFAMPC
ncbi:MAG: MBL fold metallo-hydrolase [Dehalococcoidia bacterium]|nr:MBL fold metallo-hydrolase [Dehalococcoidia bacterium]MDD5493434.1 MBL fold metallo-hydrolase [Dehalococcoidia bacterium]